MGEVFTHTSNNPGDKTHLLGWFLNSSSLEIGKYHSLHMGLMLTHGGEPSVNIIGDLQTFSNLEAGFLYGFYETYYQYERDKWWLKIGQQDINSDFLVSENGTLFTYSSFGIDAVATVNMPTPTYPVTGVSLTSQFQFSDQSNIRIGVFDGQFAVPKNNFLSIDWNLNSNDGMLYILEFEQHLLNDLLVQKVGYYYHSGNFFQL